MTAPNRRWFRCSPRTMFVGVAAIALLAAWIGYESNWHNSGPPIEFIVPVGYSGEFTIVKNRAIGEPPKFEGNKVIFTIPASGELLVADTSIFHRWHKELCRDTDGLNRMIEGLGLTVGGPDRPNTHRWDDDGVVHRWKVL